MRRWIIAFAAVIVSSIALPSQDLPLFGILQEEMNRSMAGLRMEGQPRPYYISYRTHDPRSL